MTRMVKRLSQLEIDEISLVDRPANQHGLVAIAKNDQEDTMPELYDAEGTPVDISELEVGDFVYDEAGNEYNYVITDDDDGDDGDQYDDEDAYDDELVGVGKGAAFGPLKAGERSLSRAAHGKVSELINAGERGGKRAKQYGRYGVARGRQVARRTGENLNENKYAYGGVATAGGAAGYGGGRVKKSYGQEVLETLSKAVSTSERDVVVSKAFDAVEEIAKRNDDLEEVVGFLLEQRQLDDYTEIAKSYELPMEADALGGLLQRAANVLDQEDLEQLDRILTGASTVNKALYEEVGYGGYVESDALAAVYGAADQAVAKNAELGLTREQAVTALFSANPEAYDQYELEQNQR